MINTEFQKRMAAFQATLPQPKTQPKPALVVVVEPAPCRKPSEDLALIAQYLKGAGARDSQVKAMRTAAKLIANLPEDELHRRHRDGTLTDLAGIGPASARAISESLQNNEPAWLATLRKKGTPALFDVVSVPTEAAVTTVHAPTLRCVRCGMERQRDQAGQSMRLCPECYSRQNGGVHGMDEDAPGFRLAACVTDMRMAIEIATTALRLGKHRDALLALERVKAPGRALHRLTPQQTKELP